MEIGKEKGEIKNKIINLRIWNNLLLK